MGGPLQNAGSPRDREKDPFFPFRKAQQLVGSALFWLPVSGFPMRAQERDWITALAGILTPQFQSQLELRQENFVNFDYIYPALHDTFLRRSMDFNPIPGILYQPSRPLFRPPTEEQLREILESGDASAIRKGSKSLAYWLAKKKGLAQFADFFGFGAMITLWLPVTEETKPPDIPLPKKALQNPAFRGLDVEGEIAFTYSLRDPFLPKSKALFTPGLEGDPQYGSMLFAVPLFTAENIYHGRGEMRDACLELFGAYMVESRDDHGVLLWGRPEIEPILLDALQKLESEGMQYPVR
jgi:hypothetical protein